MRFDLVDPSGNFSSWEVQTDEAQLHPHKLPIGNMAFGRWSAKDKFFVFWRRGVGHADLWALPEEAGIFSRSSKDPVRLTNGPLSYGPPLPSRDGKKLFAVGYQNRGELIRYD